MQKGFPLDLLSTTCCPQDRGPLHPVSASSSPWLGDGDVRCAACGARYPVHDGVLSLLDPQQLHPDSAMEMNVRDTRSEALLDGTRREWTSVYADATEVQPTIDAVAVRPGATLCELGCGPGRYTLPLAAQGARVVAVDFSAASLQVLRARLDADAMVALVQADVTRPFGARAAFDRMLSTLHGNLPSDVHRSRALQWMADALSDDGRAVVSMHHWSARDLLTGTAASGRYPDSGIYRRYQTRRESLAELTPFFGDVTHRYVALNLPGLPSRRLALALSHVPGLRSALSRLFLGVATRPRRVGGPPL